MATTLMAASEWAAVEFEGTDLGDRRRGRRLVNVATRLAQNPNGTLPGSFDGWAETKATYRLLSEADVEYEQVVQPHCRRVRGACAYGEHLLVEDTTTLTFTGPQAGEHLGRVGSGQGRGLHVHTTLALRVDHWNQQHPEVTA